MENVDLVSEAILSNVTLERSRWYAGGLFTLLISGEETNGAFALMHNFVRKGFEPPPHTHANEDESFYLLEGEAEFWVGDKHFTAKKNDFVFPPKNVQHSFRLKSDTAKALLQVSSAGFEKYFEATSVPAQRLELPPVPPPPTPEQIEAMMKISKTFGVEFSKS